MIRLSLQLQFSYIVLTISSSKVSACRILLERFTVYNLQKIKGENNSFQADDALLSFLSPHCYPLQGMDPLELVFAGKADEDVNGFFFKYSLYEMAGRSAEEKAHSLVCLFDYDAVEFYLQTFTDGNELTAKGQNFSIVKKAIVERYSKRKIEAEIIHEAIDLCYTVDDVQTFFRDTEKLYDDAGFTKIAQHVLIMKATHIDQKLLDWPLIRGDNTFEVAKKSGLDYERNQKVHSMGGSSSGKQGKQKTQETTMEDLCKQMKQMQLMMAKLENKAVHPKPAREPYCWKSKKTGYYAAQCTERPGDRLQCTYWGKHGHSENSCYTKQAYKTARKRGKDGDGEKITILKNDKEARSEGYKSVMVMEESVKGKL